MTLSIELFWSFRSPYSYLATPRLVEMAARIRSRSARAARLSAGGALGRIFRAGQSALGALSDAGHLSVSSKCWAFPIAGRAPIRCRRFHDHARPLRTSPISIASRGSAARRPKRGAACHFFYEVSRVIWSGEVDNWHEGDHLKKAAARAGLDLAELDREDRSRSRKIRSHHRRKSERS